MHADFEMLHLETISLFGFFLSQLWYQVSVPMQGSEDSTMLVVPRLHNQPYLNTSLLAR